MGLVLTLVSLFMAANAMKVNNIDPVELVEMDTPDEMNPLLEEDEYFDA